MAGTDQYAQWVARRIRTFAQVPSGTPLVWQAARLYQHTRRLAERPRGHGAEDALAALALSTSIYHEARWSGVLQAVREGATIEEIAIALGISIDDARDLIHRIQGRELELKRYFQQARP
ncbi:hypothetical protein [Streptomyces misionensis]|uniref:hypothetical protein n=1 Tax=Streptomyces misionensis TaxID=67331 RepID=UPI000A66D831|nr:hypothetical protein [Streptomyces misionensis]